MVWRSTDPTAATVIPMFEIEKPYARITESQFKELQHITKQRQFWDAVFVAGFAGLLSAAVCVGIIFATVAADAPWYAETLASLSLIPGIAITLVGHRKTSYYRSKREALLKSLIIGDVDELADG